MRNIVLMPDRDSRLWKRLECRENLYLSKTGGEKSPPIFLAIILNALYNSSCALPGHQIYNYQLSASGLYDRRFCEIFFLVVAAFYMNVRT